VKALLMTKKHFDMTFNTKVNQDRPINSYDYEKLNVYSICYASGRNNF